MCVIKGPSGCGKDRMIDVNLLQNVLAGLPATALAALFIAHREYGNCKMRKVEWDSNACYYGKV